MNNSTPVTTRQCGKCTACCDGWLTTEVNGIKVSPGKPCPHSRKGGCAIYENRPQYPCREFMCGWLKHGDAMPDWMRPDKCGAIVFLWYPWNNQHVINAVPTGERIPPRTLEWLKTHAQAERRPLMFNEWIFQRGQLKGINCFGFGPPAFRQQVEQLKLALSQAELIQLFSSVQNANRASNPG